MPRDPKQRDSGNFSDFEKKFLRIIDEHGWFVLSVVPGKDNPGDAWSYSTGLFFNYGHPEIIVINEPTDQRLAMINAIGGGPATEKNSNRAAAMPTSSAAATTFNFARCT
jgi:hypothetical protein